jgi:hypothetical protein
VIVPELQALAASDAEDEARILAALVLLQLRVREGVPVLITAVERDAEYAGLCGRHLARAGVAEAVPAIVARLLATPVSEVDLCVSLVEALRTLGVPL